MENLREQITSLKDEDAISAASYISQWLREEAINRQKLPEEILTKTLNDEETVNILANMFPELTDPLRKSLLNTELCQHGQIARNFLVTLSENEDYAVKIQLILNRKKFKLDPLTTMTVAAAIVYFLSIEYDIKYKNGKLVEITIRYRKPSGDTIRKILGLPISLNK